MREQALRLAVTTLFLIAVVLVSVSGASGDRVKFGMTASLQDSQIDIMLPIWLDRTVVFVPSFRAVSVEEVANDVGFGLALRYNLGHREAVPYVAFRWGQLHREYHDGPSWNDYYYGPAFGGEYFLSDHFSMGVEAQVNVTVSDDGSARFGNPGGTNVNTGTAMMATFYF